MEACCLIEFNIAQGPVEQYESKISSKILANSESWIGLNESHINRMQKVQVSNLGTPKCIIKLDSQTQKIKWQIVQRKIRQVRKTMDNKSTNLCKQALIQGQSMCDGEDLLTECITWCKKFGIRCVTLRIEKDKEKAYNLKLKKHYGGVIIKN